jgi:hypothetical protein
MNKTGRPLGSKNTPKRTLDLRDYIPPKAAKFKITSSQRKLLKAYNPEGLPDFRTKEFKNLSFAEKEDYILNELAIAKENRKEQKNEINFIGDVKYNIIIYNINDVEEYIKKNYGNVDSEIGLGDISQIMINEELINWRNECIKYEKYKNNRILFEDIYSDFYNEIDKLIITNTDGEIIINNNDKINYKYNFNIHYNNIKNTSYKDGYMDRHYYSYDNIINYNIRVSKNKLNDYIKCFIKLYTQLKGGGSDKFLIFFSQDYKNTYNIDKKRYKNYQEIRMRDASVYNLEDYENQEWDTKKGRCVFDYIINRYGNLKGLKLACNDEELIKIFDDEDALINGVNTYQINNFCHQYNIPLYAYDENDNLFHHFYPTKKNNYPSMMFKILNNHFYPIPEKFRKSFINKKVGLNIYSNLYRDEISKEGNEKKQEEIITLKSDENSLIKLGQIIKEQQKIPNINMYNGQITSIKLNDIKYLFNDNNEEINKIVLNMGLDYNGQSIQELTSIIIKDKINKSTPNINIFNQLLKAKKNRSFNGLINNNNLKKAKKKKEYLLLHANDNEYNKYDININDCNTEKIIINIQKDIFNELNKEIIQIQRLEEIKENYYYKDYDYQFKIKIIFLNELNNEIKEIQKLEAIKENYYFNDYQFKYNLLSSYNNNKFKYNKLIAKQTEFYKYDIISYKNIYKSNIINIQKPIIKAILNELNNEIIEIKKIEEIKENYYYEMNYNLIAYDINKCYSSILYEPLEEWILIDVNNDWVKFNNDDEIKLGLYYIETKDNSLFKGSNIYSSAIVKKAIEENIDFKIKMVLYADKSQSKKLFVDIIDDIIKITNNDKSLYKLMINCISGMLGKSKSTHTKANINKSLEHIYITLNNYKNQDNEIKPFITKIEETEYYLYGYNKDVKLYENNIPMYIQILDQSNIKLYDMIKKADGELIGRKVDCAIIKNPKNKLEIGDKWGDYRLSIIPDIKNKEMNNNNIYIEENDYYENIDIIDSDDYQKILNKTIKRNGCLLTGDAGTGKSYVIHKITEILGKEKIVKITPTNKSALNIKGQTIHRFLKLNKDGKIPRKTIEAIKNMNLDLIIIDEISMINKDLWKLLLLLKEETKINFLLVGDEKQLPPIEDDGTERDYFNSSIVKYLSNYNKINLTVKKRYDENLSKILEDIENINIKDFKNNNETKINICYFNKTRKIINAFWNNKMKNNNSILIKADENDETTQDIYLYKNLPLISRKTLKGGEEMINNEKFILEGYDDQYLYLLSERPDDNGQLFKHKIDIDINNLQKLFYLNYCSTTHKSQGETITEKFTIYDFNSMSLKCKYTALSRAKNAQQISLKL